MPESVSEVIAFWPSLDDFAADIGVPFHTAKNWRARRSIPARHWNAVLRAAKRRRLPITADVLVRVSAR